jgi:hypothetical protein
MEKRRTRDDLKTFWNMELKQSRRETFLQRNRQASFSRFFAQMPFI